MPHTTPPKSSRSGLLHTLCLFTLTLALMLTQAPAQAQAGSAIDCQIVDQAYGVADLEGVRMANGRVAWHFGRYDDRDIAFAALGEMSSPIYVGQRPFRERSGQALATRPAGMMLIGLTGDVILYTGRINGLTAVFIYDIAAGYSTRLSRPDQQVAVPHTDGSVVVWQESVRFFDGAQHYDVWRVVVYRIAANTLTVLNPQAGRFSQTQPVVSGNLVAYLNQEASETSLHVHRLAQRTTVEVTTGVRAVRVHDGWLSWITTQERLMALPLDNLSATPLLVSDQRISSIDRYTYALSSSHALYAASTGATSQVRLSALRNSNPARILHSDAHITDTALSGDLAGWSERDVNGRTLLRLYSRSTQSLYLAPVAGYHRTALALDGAYAAANTRIMDNYYHTFVLRCDNTATYQPPQITNQPQNMVVAAGDSSPLYVRVEGTAPFAYQWYRGAAGDTSQPVGENSSALTVTGQASPAQYWVRVSNAAGSVDSRAATVYQRPDSEASENLLTNPDFEDGGALPTGWNVNNRSNDRRMCNRDTNGDGIADKIFADSGDCAFLFRPSANENSVLVQRVRAANLPIETRGTLVLETYFNAPHAQVNSIVRVVVRYTDGRPNSVVSMRLYQTSGYEYAEIAVPVASPHVRDVAVRVINRSRAGRVLIDDLSLNFYSSINAVTSSMPDDLNAEGWLELPAAPDLRGQ